MKNLVLAISLLCNLTLVPWLAFRALQLDQMCRAQMVYAVELAYEIGYARGKGSDDQAPLRNTRLQVAELTKDQLTVVIHPALGRKLLAYFSDERCRATMAN